MGVENLISLDYSKLQEACVALEKLGPEFKVRVIGQKKTMIITNFLSRLLEVPEDREGELADVIFEVEATIREKLGTDTIRESINLLGVEAEPTPAPEPTPVVTPPEVETTPTPVEPEVLPVGEVTPPEKKKRGRPAVEKPPKEPKPPKVPKPPKEGVVKRGPRSEMNKVLSCTKFVWEHLTMTFSQVEEAMTKAKIPFSLATLGFEYRAVHRSYKILKELGKLK